MRGWLGYYGIAEMDTLMKQWNEWLRRRIRMYIWKQWKKPKTRIANLKKLGMPEWQVYRNGNTRKGYWAIAGSEKGWNFGFVMKTNRTVFPWWMLPTAKLFSTRTETVIPADAVPIMYGQAMTAQNFGA